MVCFSPSRFLLPVESRNIAQPGPWELPRKHYHLLDVGERMLKPSCGCAYGILALQEKKTVWV